MREVVTVDPTTLTSDRIAMTINAVRFGSCLYQTATDAVVNISVSQADALDMFSELLTVSDKRALQGVHPFPERFDIRTNMGPLTLDAHLSEEFLAALTEVVVQHDLGDLLEQYKPE